MKRTIIDNGINWTWYFVGNFDDTNKTVEVLCFDRFHNYDTPIHPIAEKVRWFRKTEDANRILQSVRVNDTDYTVINPKYIFDYKNFAAFDFPAS